jgi:hypothetical protein
MHVLPLRLSWADVVAETRIDDGLQDAHGFAEKFPAAIVRGCARLCVNPELFLETNAPSRTAAHTQTALLLP